MTSNTFNYCYIAEKGGAIYLSDVKSFTDTGSSYTKCGASDKGGAIYLKSVPSVALSSLTFDGNAA